MPKDYNEARKKFIHKRAGDGKRGPFYNGTQPWFFDVNDECLFINAVWQGYLDTSRTCIGIDTTKNGRKAFYNLAGKLKVYFETDEIIDYDKLHSCWCKELIDDVKAYHSYLLRYGQAQKIINMAMKYLYCCEGSEKFYAKFLPCHMPLDRYTLVWFFLKKQVLYENWSYCSEETYKYIQKEMRILLGENILEHESVIWEEMQNRIIDLKNK